MKAAIPALFAVLTACAVSEDEELAVDLQSPDDKADGLQGRRLGLSFPTDIVSLIDPEEPHADELIVRYTASDKLVVQSTRYLIAKEHVEPALEFGDIMQSARFTTTTPGVTVGLVMFYDARHPYTCRTPRGPVNYFTSIVADFERHELTLNDTTTVSFADCGIVHDAIMFAPVPTRWPGQEIYGIDYTLEYDWL